MSAAISVFGQPLAAAALAATCLWLALGGWLRLRGDTLDDLDVADLALVRSARRRPRLGGGPLGALGRRLGPPLGRLLGSYRTERMRRTIQLAGSPKGLTLERHLEHKARLLAVFGTGSLVLVALGHPLWGVLVLAVAWLLPDLTLRLARQRRQARIRADLPDFLDILAVTVNAGLSFRAALERVAGRYQGPVAEEITLTLRQMDVGESRRAAFSALRDRNESDVLDRFVTALLQAEELGAPLAETLNQIALDIRRTSAQQARQHAARTSPRVALVVTLIMVPGALVLLATAMLLSSQIDIGGLLSGGG